MKPVLCIFLFSVCFSACKKDDQNSTSPAVAIEINSFPHTSGNRWEYYTESHIKSSGQMENSYFASVWTIEKDTLIKGKDCFKINQVDSNYNHSVYRTDTYYNNASDGLYEVATKKTGPLMHFRNALHKESDPSNRFSIGYGIQDTVFVADTSLILLRFSSVLNETWKSHEYGHGTIIKRKYIDYSTVSTAAGAFNCIRLMFFYDNDNNNVPDTGKPLVYQYISEKGLIKEVLSMSSTSLVWNRTSALTKINF